MLEIIKEAGAILKDLPDLAIWILVGILFYKVAIIGSIFGIIKLAIIKVHDAITRPKEVIRNVCISDKFITHDGTYTRFVSLVEKVMMHRDGTRKHNRLFNQDVEWLTEAVEEKMLKEMKEKK